jgi:hypothetical protein
MSRIRIIAVLAALAAMNAPAGAQEWPARPVTMVVPFAAGGGFDVMGRVFAQRLSETLGQQVIVENISGAAGIVGTNRVAKAAPDGYMFLLGSVGTQAYNPTLYKKLPYNPAADFASVALFAEQPMVLITRKDFPANNLQEFVAHVKENGAKLQYGSAGVGSPSRLRPAQRSCWYQRYACSLSRRRTRDGGSGGGPRRLHVRQQRQRGSADRQRDSKGYRDIGGHSLTAIAVACNRARTGPDKFRSGYVDRFLHA